MYQSAPTYFRRELMSDTTVRLQSDQKCLDIEQYGTEDGSNIWYAPPRVKLYVRACIDVTIIYYNIHGACSYRDCMLLRAHTLIGCSRATRMIRTPHTRTRSGCTMQPRVPSSVRCLGSASRLKVCGSICDVNFLRAWVYYMR